jgi:hypothetical protein
MKNNTNKKRTSIQLRWSEIEFGYRYDDVQTFSTETRMIRGFPKPVDPLKFTNMDGLGYESILDKRSLKRKEVSDYLASILPSLKDVDSANITIEEIEALDFKIIDELDGLRLLNQDTGEFYESDEFLALEDKFVILQEALHCLSREQFDTSPLNEEVTKSVQLEGWQETITKIPDTDLKAKKPFRNRMKFNFPFKCFVVSVDDL